MKTPCSNHGAQGGRHPRLRSPCHQVSFHFSSSSGVLKPFLTTVWLTHTWDHLSGEVTPRQPFRGCRMSPWGPLLRVPAAQPPSLAGGADAFAAPASALIFPKKLWGPGAPASLCCLLLPLSLSPLGAEVCPVMGERPRSEERVE